MNLLIVDDEFYSRDNIREMLPWEQYGISKIEEADDGVNALKICDNYKPDIVLTDIKMPRMDGIELSFKLKQYFPDCAIIFMSGYCDKEYLKSAIKLKAISYIEKPIEKDEIIEAVKSAVDSVNLNLSNRQKSIKIAIENNELLYMIHNKLALSLIGKNINAKEIQNHFSNVGIKLPLSGYFITILVKLYNVDNLDLDEYTQLNSLLFSTVQDLSEETSVNTIYTLKDNYILLHIYDNIFNETLSFKEKINNFCLLLKTNLNTHNLIFIICAGNIETELSDINRSYHSAASSIQHAFFKEPNCICFNESSSPNKYIFKDTVIDEYKTNLISSSAEYTLCFIKGFTADIRKYEGTSDNEVRKYYFRLLYELLNLSYKKSVDVFPEFLGEHELWQHILSINFLSELSDFLFERTRRFFILLKEKVDNNGPVDMIIKYIHKNYQNDTLSVTLLSNELKLAPTYISWVFKKKTGKNLNKYITEYRIEKAKELLGKKSVKVCDISALVGYRDSNYFAKLFKKHTGQSPSEYREN